MPNDILLKYATSATLTCAVESLASDTALLAGIESSVIDNTTAGYDDYLASGKVKAGTSPTATRQIEVWAVAWDGSAWPDVFDGTAGAETITSAEIKAAICRPVAIMATTNTTDRVYHFSGVSLRQAFGGTLPSKVVLFVVHNTGVALNSSGHEFRVQGVYAQVQ
jgi:hypothetical protein